MSSVESSRWLPADDEADAEGAAETDVIDSADADDNDDSCRVMADTICLLLLPRTRLFRAASLAGYDDASISTCFFRDLRFDCNSCVSVRAQPRGWRGGGEGLVGRLCRTMAGGSGGKYATSIGVCASATALLRMMLATGQCLVPACNM